MSSEINLSPFTPGGEGRGEGDKPTTTTEDNIAIRVENLSKCYHIYDRPRDRLLQMMAHGRRQYFREFWALKDVSFDVKKGETVGIVGRNGSGKSTLLQMICGTLNPTSGSIRTHGRIAALLELGSGFNPEFTGLENVYLNAAVLGLSKDEIDACYDDIAAFADIGEFMEQPVRTYSSGMMVRLAFAVQAQVSPNILIIDEALAVGDAKFQAKCFERLKQLKASGTSILLVTHSSEQIVTHCSRALLLNSGSVLEMGEPRRVVNRYMDLLFGKEPKSFAQEPYAQLAAVAPDDSIEGLNCADDVFSTRACYNPDEYRWGDGAATILDFLLCADNQSYPSAVSIGQTIKLSVAVKFNAELVRPIFGINVKTKEGVTVYGANSETLGAEEFKTIGKVGSVVVVEVLFGCRLAPGDYFISLGVATKEGEEVIPHDRRYDVIHLQVRPEPSFFGLVDLGLSLAAREVN